MLKTILIFSVLCFSEIHAQETNGRIYGRVVTQKTESPGSATITVVHEPTKNKTITFAGADGSFHLFNLKPGGPYTATISLVEFETLKVSGLFVNLHSESFLLDDLAVSEFSLKKKTLSLDTAFITAPVGGQFKNGMQTTLSLREITAMPTITRGIHDLLRLVPQARINGEGVISLAGQNNRLNSFYIDGTNSTDIQGLSATGMNGGQTGSPPVSIEAIEEVSVLLSPYDVQYGHFTGGSINTITRSGSNLTKTSAWYFFRNENMAGKSPVPQEKPGYPGEYYRPRLSSFFNQTFGIWNSGALVKDKLFYFFLVEKQSETRPQPYDISVYRGNSSQDQLAYVSEFVKTNYGYDPGSFTEAIDDLDATRANLKLEWNLSPKNKFMFSYRYNGAARIIPRQVNNTIAVAFANSGIRLPSVTHSVSTEWKTYFNRKMNNRLLFSYNNQLDDRERLGDPFPFITIRDGAGTISLGSESNTGSYNFKANEFTLFNVLKLSEKNQVFSLGVDLNYAILNNRYIPNFFGAYSFRNTSEFTNETPVRLQRSYPQTVETENPARFQTLRTSLFFADEIRIGTRLKINMGVRLDVNSVLSDPQEDKFFNDSAINIISGYYDLEGARSGKASKANWAFSPRIGLDYIFPKQKLNLKFGTGLFLGRIVNLWVSDLFNSINGGLDIIPQQYGIGFNPSPYQQPTATSLGLDPENHKGSLILMSEKFRQPVVFRTSLSAGKKLPDQWTISLEGIFTKNVQEPLFRNVNILPPTLVSDKPDSRNVYSKGLIPSKIPLKSNGVNPYTQVILLTNNHGKTGSAYSVSMIVNKQLQSFTFNTSYTFSQAKVLNEITGAQTPVLSQWRNVETVNGRNFAPISTSDNDMQHRIAAWVSNQIKYAKGKMATTISVFYEGKSGIPYSYVYNFSMINDNGRTGENFDLIYIPTETDLTNMTFIPVSDQAGQVYSGAQQKEFLNEFIENDKYLKKHRGAFAERNAARLPFTHLIDLRVQQDISFKLKNKILRLSIIADIFNVANLLNKDWGHSYFLPNDSYPLIYFAGFANSTTVTPQYQFLPIDGKPYTTQTSTVPGNSARWISQLGMRINFE